MDFQKETASPVSLAAGPGEAVLGTESPSRSGQQRSELQRNLRKISSQKRTGLKLADYMRENRLQIAAREGDSETVQADMLARIEKAAENLSTCASWLLFGEHVETKKLKLIRAQTCRQAHLCLFCQARRALRLVNNYSERMQAVDGIHLHVTLTMPNTPDLLAGIRLLRESFRKLWERKRIKGTGPLRNALGAVCSVEITRGKDGKWHPHMHCLITMTKESRGFISYDELRREWSKLTGGRQLRVEVVLGRDDLVEVLKYSVKPQEAGDDGLDGPARVEVWRLLGGKRIRLLSSYGCYYGVQDEDEAEDEEPLLLEDYRLFFFRWLRGEYFSSYDPRTMSQEGQQGA